MSQDEDKILPTKSESIEYSYFCVAFIDMLGQKEVFLEGGKYLDTIEENLENLESLKKKLAIAHAKTYDAIVAMRTQFQSFL